MEAARRLARDGPNALRAVPPTRWWRRLLAQFKDPLVGFSGFAAAVALTACWVEGQHATLSQAQAQTPSPHGPPMDAIVILLVVMLNAVLGFLQEAKAASAVAALARLTAVTSTVLRHGQPQRLPSEAVVLGDVLLLAEGDAVVADARLVVATQLRVLDASLTGESAAVLKNPATQGACRAWGQRGPDPKPDRLLAGPSALGDRLNMVFKGTAVAQGSGRGGVTAFGMHTEMGAIATLLDTTPAAPTSLQHELGRIGRRLGLAALLVAAARGAGHGAAGCRFAGAPAGRG